MKNNYIKSIIILLVGLIQISCEDLVEVPVPNDRIVSQTVFEKDKTANSAVIGIYNELYNSSFSSGLQTSISVLAGLSADNLESTVSTSNLIEYEENEIFISNSYNLNIWSSAYNIIYMTNAVLAGLNNSNNISQNLKEQLEGETRFIRGFTYFYLVNLYGNVPLVLTPNYENNAVINRSKDVDIYNQVIEDLEVAADVLDGTYEDGERLRVNAWVAKAFLARVHLYLGNWGLAEDLSTQVIEASETYQLLDNLNEVFLANSQEAIWQITPLAAGFGQSNTNEGSYFIMENNRENVALKEDFINSFDENDLRLRDWIGTFQTDNSRYFFPYKYKIKNATGTITEYSMVLRLAEQYFIRAEARTHQGNLAEAIEDLDKIRSRANLNSIVDSHPEINQEFLLDIIMQERRREFFTEWGHRWLDLKRTEKASEILSPIKPLWESSDVLYPIPEEELSKNPNLDQNIGY